MLVQLKIVNIGLVSDSTIMFGPGFNVITGETGAGKSMTVGAVNLISGERTSSGILSPGVEKGSVEAFFDLEEQKNILETLSGVGVDCEDGQLVIRREIFSNGKNRCLVNGALVTLTQIKQIGDMLIDIHGPHDHQSLLRSSYHIYILDSFAGLEKERETYASCYQDYVGLRDEKERLLNQTGADESMTDFLKFQINEIDQASLDEAEEEELLKEEALLENVVSLREYGQSAYDELYASDGSVIERVAEIKTAVEKIAEIENSFLPSAEKVEEIIIDLKDITDQLRDFNEKLDYDPERVRYIDDRLSLINKLKRKFSGSVHDIILKKDEMQEKLQEIEHADELLVELEERIGKSEGVLTSEAAVLSEKRHKASRQLSQEVEKVLHTLGMNGATFSIRMSSTVFNENGIDRVEFYISTNKGIDQKPLKEVASSGEISRVMLAIKKIIALTDKIPIMIFDEIDVNIGGKTADIVGDQMREIANNHQLLVISHLPQIAVKASHHFIVTKELQNNRTAVSVTSVSGDERVEEVARMLGGKDLTSVTVDHARELLGKK